MEIFLNISQSLLKAHYEHCNKLSDNYTNLQEAYSNLLRSNESGNANCPIQNKEVIHQTRLILAERTKERDEMDLIYENLMRYISFYFQENNSNVEDLLNMKLSLIKAHIEHRNKLFEVYTNLRELYSSLIKSNELVTENCLLKIETPEVILENIVIVAERIEERDETRDG